MNSPVEQIKERLAINDVISGYVKLIKAGTNFKARCPFHNEKTASFFVSPTRGTYHCFGCGKGGDVFSFLQEIEGMTFPEALNTLAERAGISIEKIPLAERNKHDLLYKALEYSARFFTAHLERNAEAKRYLEGRGLTEETIKKFRVGFAPDGWRTLSEFLLSKGFREKTLEEAGLFVPSAKGGYDKFRGRIMFPITDPQGRVVAFTGRIMPSLEKDDMAKYMNSPETALYNKSKILFGYSLAKLDIMKADECVIVEGQMDLLMITQAGTTNAVAVSGTALTALHLKLIKRFTEHIVFCFDADSAGFKALERAITTAFVEDMDVLSVSLPSGTDPADLVKEGKEKWQKALVGKKPFIEFYLDYIGEKSLSEREFMKEVTKNVLPYVHYIKSPVTQAYYIKHIAEKLHVPEESVGKELQNIRIDLPEREGTLRAHEPSVQKDAILNKLAGILMWQKSLAEPALPVEEIRKRMEKILKMTYDEGTLLASEEEAFKAEVYYTDETLLKREVEELLLNLEQEILEKEFMTLTKRITELEKSGDVQDIEKYLGECQEISKRINEIKSSRHNSN